MKTVQEALNSINNSVGLSRQASAISIANDVANNHGYYTALLTHTGYNPADSTTYYIGASFGALPTTASGNWYSYVVPISGTVTAIYLNINVNSTSGSSETSTVSLNINNTTDYTVSSSVVHDTSVGLFSLTDQNISVTAGDKLKMKIVTPAWTTNPVGVIHSMTVFIQY